MNIILLNIILQLIIVSFVFFVLSSLLISHIGKSIEEERNKYIDVLIEDLEIIGNIMPIDLEEFTKAYNRLKSFLQSTNVETKSAKEIQYEAFYNTVKQLIEQDCDINDIKVAFNIFEDNIKELEE